MIFPCWLCREILKLFLVVLLRVVFRLYEGRGVGVHKYFDILESHGQLVVTGWLWERWLRAFLSGVSKTPTRGRGSVLSFVSQRMVICAALDS